MTLKKIVYISVGLLSLALGAIGAIVPMMPAFPFLLLAAFCFSKSSTRLTNWFKNTKLYQNNLESYTKGQGMTKATKIRLMITVTLIMGFSFLMMFKVPMGQLVLSIVWLFHLWYFWFKVKTIET